MPCETLTFRAICGNFAFVLWHLLCRRGEQKRKSRVRVLNIGMRWTITLIFVWLLLQLCGDVELNPGPADSSQSKLTSSSWAGSGRATGSGPGVSTRSSNTLSSAGKPNIPSQPGAGPTLEDVMAKLNSLGTDMCSMKTDMSGMAEKVNTMSSDFTHIKNQFDESQNRINDLETEVTRLHQQNNDLLRRVDDLEDRSRRNNVVFHGIEKTENENCEQVVKNLCSENLGIGHDIIFDRVHRIGNDESKSIIARCAFYKDREMILKNKKKLIGSDIFVGEDFSKSTRNIRKKLNEFRKQLKNEGKKTNMVYDHLYVDGKKYALSPNGDSLIECVSSVASVDNEGDE